MVIHGIGNAEKPNFLSVDIPQCVRPNPNPNPNRLTALVGLSNGETGLCRQGPGSLGVNNLWEGNLSGESRLSEFNTKLNISAEVSAEIQDHKESYQVAVHSQNPEYDTPTYNFLNGPFLATKAK